MTTFLLLYTEPPTRRVFARLRAGRLAVSEPLSHALGGESNRLILASGEITADDRAVYDECIALPPPTEVEATLDILRGVRADRVIAQTEYGLLPGSLLGAGPSPQAALLCTNKWLSRQALHRAGVPVPRFALASTAGEVRRFAERYPVVLKPVASTLGRLVARVDSEKDVEARVDAMRAALPDAFEVRRCAAFARAAGLDMDCDPATQFLVEDYADGPPLETDGLVIGDRIDCFGATEQVVSAPPYFFIEGYLFPTDAPELLRITEAAVRAVGLRDAGFSIEFRGSTVIEVNGRLGEDAGFPDLFEAALGTYPILKWIARDDTPLAPRARAAIAYANCYRAGRVRSISTSDGACVLLQAGEDFAPYGRTGPHMAYALATDPTSCAAAYREARARVGQFHFDME